MCRVQHAGDWRVPEALREQAWSRGSVCLSKREWLLGRYAMHCLARSVKIQNLLFVYGCHKIRRYIKVLYLEYSDLRHMKLLVWDTNTLKYPASPENLIVLSLFKFWNFCLSRTRKMEYTG